MLHAGFCSYLYPIMSSPFDGSSPHTAISHIIHDQDTACYDLSRNTVRNHFCFRLRKLRLAITCSNASCFLYIKRRSTSNNYSFVQFALTVFPSLLDSKQCSQSLKPRLLAEEHGHDCSTHCRQTCFESPGQLYGTPSQPDGIQLPPLSTARDRAIPGSQSAGRDTNSQQLLASMPKGQPHSPHVPTQGHNGYCQTSSATMSTSFRTSQYGSRPIVKRRKASMLEGFLPVELPSSRALRELAWHVCLNVHPKHSLNGSLGFGGPHNCTPLIPRGLSAAPTSYQPQVFSPCSNGLPATPQPLGPHGFGLHKPPPTSQNSLHGNIAFGTIPRRHYPSSRRRDATLLGHVPCPEICRGTPSASCCEARCEARQDPRFGGFRQLLSLFRVSSEGSRSIVRANNGSYAQYQRKRKSNLPRSATDQLKAWFEEHHDSPYPTEEQKQALCGYTGLFIHQVRVLWLEPM